MRKFVWLSLSVFVVSCLALAASGDLGEQLGLFSVLRHTLAVTAVAGFIGLLGLLSLVTLLVGIAETLVVLDRDVFDTSPEPEEPAEPGSSLPGSLSDVISSLRAKGYKAEFVDSNSKPKSDPTGPTVSDITAGLDISSPDRR